MLSGALAQGGRRQSLNLIINETLSAGRISLGEPCVFTKPGDYTPKRLIYQRQRTDLNKEKVMPTFIARSGLIQFPSRYLPAQD